MVIYNLYRKKWKLNFALLGEKLMKNGTISKLNKKQIQVLKYSAAGLTETGVALNLNISVNTVKYHKRNIYKKLGVNSLTAAVVKALKKELIILEELKI